MFFFLFLIFLIVAASLWFQGLWSAGLSLINILLAAMIATNFYEPIAAAIEGIDSSFTYLLDFTVLWIVFAFTFGILRLFTDIFSKTRVYFDMPVEMAGRSLLAVWAAWLFVCFTAFSLHMAPLNSPTPMGAWKSPDSGVFFNADRLWLRFMHSRSKGALARGNPSVPQYPGDDEVQAFDPFGEFILKYRQRRENYANAEGMRVQ
jgi:hypothetical protein